MHNEKGESVEWGEVILSSCLHAAPAFACSSGLAKGVMGTVWSFPLSPPAFACLHFREAGKHCSGVDHCLNVCISL
jgi:hypothetical protein